MFDNNYIKYIYVNNIVFHVGATEGPSILYGNACYHFHFFTPFLIKINQI